MSGPSARRRIRPIATLLATAFLAALFTAIPAAHHRPADASLTGKLAPTDAALFGAYVKPSGWSQTAVKQALTQRENQLGRRFDVSHFFYEWGKAFPTWKERWDVQMGRIPFIAWSHIKTTDVNAGKYDAYIRARADAVKQFRSPLFLRWFPEMDTRYHATTAVSAAEYVKAWRRIHTIFKNRGATNAVWVWCGTAAGFEHGRAQPFYPGAAYVDWGCADGYNWAPGKDVPWTSFAEIFRPFYNWGAKIGKPLMIAETGTEEDVIVGRKATWIRDMGNAVKNQFPLIKALVYFDAKATDFAGDTYDWRTNTSPSSLQAWGAVGRDPYFKWNRVYRPDAHIKGAGRNVVGEDVYGGDQVVGRRLRGKGATRFAVTVENDGNISDVYSLRATAAKKVRLRFLLGNRDITEEVKKGDFLTKELQPGESVTITVEVSAGKKRIRKRTLGFEVTSGGDQRIRDAVEAKIRSGKGKKKKK